jgi:hypothetical protein
VTAAAKKPKPCKNAGTDAAHAKRPAIHPGPRCATCHRAARKMARQRAHQTRVGKVYTLPDGAYEALYVAQGGRCAWPKCRATGRVKRLAVDHDHSCCPGSTSCGKCVRGLLCGHHNQEIGRNGDDPEVFAGVAAYLRRPPAPAVLLAWDGAPAALLAV